jgi:hypothetical protein
MSRTKNLPKHTAVSVRIPDDLLKAADSLQETLAKPGFWPTRVDVLRMALARGLEVLKKENARVAAR